MDSASRAKASAPAWTLCAAAPAAVPEESQVYETPDAEPTPAPLSVGRFTPCSAHPLVEPVSDGADGALYTGCEDGGTCAHARTRLRARIAAAQRTFVPEVFGDRLEGECYCMEALDSGSDEESEVVCCPGCGNEFELIKES